ncbi:toxin-antitoxin system YwqK family antitoxin [Plebeiibacterium sediminum]|uniref:Toxin-antitoxin system YwqK family antitoxin n=1 Tax=Plebeiibacterium sediminum TaxID=2992112 RepID=A0AAE3M4X1_9BACT|nr:toxin-antitoxin system YwqK family antitoxin [Plebeiobacterium sediminum]MCW3787199.1 toxin-antitoxin system YwqK family antitoxin [Plebeiobacterium sediminum]
MIQLQRYFFLISILIFLSTFQSWGNNLIFIQSSDTINITDSHHLKQGWWKTVFDSNKIKEEGKYVNDKKHGIWTSYYESGNKKSEISYINGEAKGLATFYYENGKIREKGNWQIDHWTGNYKYYYENGQISYNWNYNNDGRREGEQFYYHENGNKMYQGTWNNGKTEGNLLVYNDKGLLVQKKNYADGKINTTEDIALNTPKQNIETEQNNIDDTSDIPRLKFEGTGNHTVINDNGKISLKGFFVKGKLFNGEKFNYDNNKQLISITYYKNGKKAETKPISDIRH